MNPQNKDNEKKQNSTWNIKPYLAMGLTALIVMMIAVVFFFFVYRYEGASQWVQLAFRVLEPVMFGIIIAYLLNPLLNRIENFFKEKSKFKAKTVRMLSITGALVIALLLLMSFFWVVIPQVYASLEELVIGMPNMIKDTMNNLQVFWERHEILEKYFGETIKELTDNFSGIFEMDILPRLSVIISQVTSGIFSFAKSLLNVIIGFIVAVYILMEKEHFLAIAKKVVFGLCSRKVGNVIVSTMEKTHSIFSGFIIGKIIDSIIIGFLTFFILIIFRMPSALLVSVIVGVTNVIPFFGPFIGAIPSFFLILIQDPIKSLWFIVMILVIQQLDGNIIGPKILGNTTGLSSFWVITAILLSGGLFGVPGMILGVPMFAVIYFCVGEITKYLLRKKGLPEETDDYLLVKERDVETGELIYYEKETEEENKN